MKDAMRNLHYIFWTKYYEYIFSSNRKCNHNNVYMFHSICDGETNPKKFETNKKTFELFIKEELKYKKAVSVENIIGEKENGKFAITFDDVYENFYINAYPILKKYNVPFTLFVSTGLLDKEGYLTKDEMRILSNDKLCTIGAHTVNHTRLRKDRNSYNEIKMSKIELESILKRKIQLFAYPYGSIYACSKRNIKEVKKLGFTVAFSTIRGCIPKNTDKYRFFLPRINGDHCVKKIEERGKKHEAGNCSSRI